VRFEDEVQIEVVPARVGGKSVTYQFVFSHASREIARGEMTSVCCRFDEGGQPRSVTIPEWFREKIS